MVNRALDLDVSAPNIVCYHLSYLTIIVKVIIIFKCSELGSNVIGLRCSDIMDLEYYDVTEAVTSIYSSADMPSEMVIIFY